MSAVLARALAIIVYQLWCGISSVSASRMSGWIGVPAWDSEKSRVGVPTQKRRATPGSASHAFALRFENRATRNIDFSQQSPTVNSNVKGPSDFCKIVATAISNTMRSHDGDSRHGCRRHRLLQVLVLPQSIRRFLPRADAVKAMKNLARMCWLEQETGEPRLH